MIVSFVARAAFILSLISAMRDCRGASFACMRLDLTMSGSKAVRAPMVATTMAAHQGNPVET